MWPNAVAGLLGGFLLGYIMQTLFDIAVGKQFKYLLLSALHLPRLLRGIWLCPMCWGDGPSRETGGVCFCTREYQRRPLPIGLGYVSCSIFWTQWDKKHWQDRVRYAFLPSELFASHHHAPKHGLVARRRLLMS